MVEEAEFNRIAVYAIILLVVFVIGLLYQQSTYPEVCKKEILNKTSQITDALCQPMSNNTNFSNVIEIKCNGTIVRWEQRGAIDSTYRINGS